MVQRMRVYNRTHLINMCVCEYRHPDAQAVQRFVSLRHRASALLLFLFHTLPLTILQQRCCNSFSGRRGVAVPRSQHVCVIIRLYQIYKCCTHTHTSLWQYLAAKVRATHVGRLSSIPAPLLAHRARRSLTQLNLIKLLKTALLYRVHS